MRTLALPCLALLLLAGCAAPAKEAPVEPAPAPLPADHTLDLRTAVGAYAMPEGHAALLLQANVTKDMWMRPTVGWFAAGGPWLPVRDETFWILCPRVQAVGLPDDATSASPSGWRTDA